jgi:hypothetical protein
VELALVRRRRLGEGRALLLDDRDVQLGVEGLDVIRDERAVEAAADNGDVCCKD